MTLLIVFDPLELPVSHRWVYRLKITKEYDLMQCTEKKKKWGEIITQVRGNENNDTLPMCIPR